MAVDEKFIVVLITAASAKEARLLGRKLIEEKTAACVNSTSVNSLFLWKGKTERAGEVLLIVKTRRSLFKKLEAVVKKHHSYTVPEIIALPVIAGSKSYLDWVKESTR